MPGHQQNVVEGDPGGDDFSIHVACHDASSVWNELE
jgi:hypothetical protein